MVVMREKAEARDWEGEVEQELVVSGLNICNVGTKECLRLGGGSRSDIQDQRLAWLRKARSGVGHFACQSWRIEGL